MKTALLCVFSIFAATFSCAQIKDVEKAYSITYQGILSGQFHDLFIDNKEYKERCTRYEIVFSDYSDARAKIDQFTSFVESETLSVYFKSRALHIAALAKNNDTGDVYEQARNYGIDFVLVLNDIIPLITLYECERVLVSTQKEMAELESWAKSMAAISEYFKHLFIEGKLNKSLGYYTRVQSYDRQIDRAFKNFKRDGKRLKEQPKINYEAVFDLWQSYQEELRLGKGREDFFDTLEKKYGN